MLDVIFFLLFGWVLTGFNVDTVVLGAMASIFVIEFPLFIYYLLFAGLGVISNLLFSLHRIIGRD